MSVLVSATSTFPAVTLHLPEMTFIGDIAYDPHRRVLEVHYPEAGPEVLSLDMSYYS